MRFNAADFTKMMCVMAPALIPVLPHTAAKADIPIERLTGSNPSTFSNTALIGSPTLTPLRPRTAKQWTPSPVTSRSVPAFWSVSPSTSRVATQPPVAPPTAITQSSAPSASLPILPTQAAEANSQPATATATEAESTPPTRTDQESLEIAQSVPSLEDIQQIQRELRGLDVSAPVGSRRSVYPGITISNPSGYGAERGQVFAGIGFQSRTRFSGGANPGTVFGGGARDGTAGIGFGIGNARESVGLQLSYTAASFGGSRDPLSGGFNAKLHKQFGRGWAAAIGGEGIINIGRLPEDDDEIEFNDFEGTYYGVITRTISLREDFSQPFSRLTLTGGAGSGRFRTVDQIANGEFAVGVFGSAALQVFPSTNLITEWTGQDLAVGLSVAPFPDFPIVFTPAIRDIAGEGDGDPRFVLGVGVSLSEIFSRLGL